MPKMAAPRGRDQALSEAAPLNAPDPPCKCKAEGHPLNKAELLNCLISPSTTYLNRLPSWS